MPLGGTATFQKSITSKPPDPKAPQLIAGLFTPLGTVLRLLYNFNIVTYTRAHLITLNYLTMFERLRKHSVEESHEEANSLNKLYDFFNVKGEEEFKTLIANSDIENVRSRPEHYFPPQALAGPWMNVIKGVVNGVKIELVEKESPNIDEDAIKGSVNGKKLTGAQAEQLFRKLSSYINARDEAKERIENSKVEAGNKNQTEKLK